ncbi:hypothetical protein AVL55_07795 [Alteromonas macleodii]|uniref:Uncharacterized protein n=1 Tax=Alteromonas macleodii TaxID=28108 RepID=A0A126Q0V4_ALTMA|nr:hypothetical protein AVL55_07795 [Alteromonas macleodii]
MWRCFEELEKIENRNSPKTENSAPVHFCFSMCYIIQAVDTLINSLAMIFNSKLFRAESLFYN